MTDGGLLGGVSYLVRTLDPILVKILLALRIRRESEIPRCACPIFSLIFRVCTYKYIRIVGLTFEGDDCGVGQGQWMVVRG